MAIENRPARPEPLRIGVLGAARIAELAIVKPARTTGHRLAAIAARDRHRAEDFADRYGVERALDSYADVIADTEVEVIYNPLANALHGPWNLAAIRANTCSPRSPSPATPTKRARSATPRHRQA
jgi:predicted dehydrogenase